MNTFIRLMIISMLMLVASPAYSDAIQIFNCQYVDEATEDEAREMVEKWLAAAKQIEGGKNLRVFVRFPIAASTDDIDFKFVMVSPNFSEWGDFTDHYEVSKIVEIDDELEKVIECNDASMWEGIEIE